MKKLMIGQKAWTAAILAALVSSAAWADGALSLSFNGTQGFIVLDIKESGGIREGTYGGGFVTAKRQDNQLQMTLDGQSDALDIVPSGPNTSYRGRLWNGSDLTTLTHASTHDGFTIFGNASATYVRLNVNTNRGQLSMMWKDSKGVDYYLELKKTSASEAGSCKGSLYASAQMITEEVAKIFCHSSGKLEDTLFRDADDIIAWLIHLQIFPDDDDAPAPNP